MRLGLFSVNSGVCVDPDVLCRVAQAAEAAGLDSLWAGEHVVLPDPQVPPAPLPPEVDMVDPTVVLTYAAACTRTIRLATGIIILPQRNPLVLAKELASLDVLSRGRLIFGIGVGYLAPEFAALGVPLADRGRRADEYLDAMQAIWDEEKPAYRGRYVSFSGVQARPRPVQRPTPPIVVGGRTDAAYRRAVTRGYGWYGYMLDVDQTRESIEGLRRVADTHDRPAGLGELEITVTPRGRLDAARVAEFAALGVDRLVVLPRPSFDEAALVAFIEESAALVR